MKKGFTLAEVLITLGIIGVIAAITLPTVITNYQKQVTISRLKKVYTELNQVIKISESFNGERKYWNSYIDIGVSSYFDEYLRPYFKSTKTCNNYKECGYNNDWSWRYIKEQNFGYSFSNNGRLNFYDNIGNLIVLYPSRNAIYVDINGNRTPNRFGRDIFVFNFNLGMVTSEDCHYNDYGTSCAKKIIQDGWQIKEDYPW